MPTLIAGAVAVIVLYLLLQMFRAANPAVLARALKVVGGRGMPGDGRLYRLAGRVAVAIPLGIFGAGLLGWAPFGTTAFNNIGGFFSGFNTQRSAGQSLASPLAIPGDDARSRQRRAGRGGLWPGPMPGIRSTSSICRSLRR